MADKPKMNGAMKKSWAGEIIDSIYTTMSGEKPAPKKEYNARPVNKKKANDFMKGFGYKPDDE